MSVWPYIFLSMHFFLICRYIRLYLFVFLLVCLLIIYLSDRIYLFTLVPIYQSVYLSAHHIYIHTCVHQSIYLSVHHIYVHKSVKPGAPVRTHASKRYSEPRPNAIACDWQGLWLVPWLRALVTGSHFHRATCTAGARHTRLTSLFILSGREMDKFPPPSPRPAKHPGMWLLVPDCPCDGWPSAGPHNLPLAALLSAFFILHIQEEGALAEEEGGDEEEEEKEGHEE